MYVPIWLFIPAAIVLILAVRQACKATRQLDQWQRHAIQHQAEIIELLEERGELREALNAARRQADE